MLHVRPVGVSVVSYYIRQGAGQWTGRGAGHLGIQGAVEAGDLRAVLQGRHPVSGRILPEARRTRRRAGWDLVFTAPKSLSLLAASGAYGQRIAGAHQAATAEALSQFEECHLHVRRSSAPGGRSAATGAVAARFDHTRNAGGEPHLHSHLLLANLARDLDGRWWSVGPWWLERTEMDAVYTLALRHHLVARGVELDWRVRPDGLVDVAGVPRAALRATSTRGQEVAAGARYSGRSSDPDRPWRRRAQAAGWEPSAAGPPAARASQGDPDLRVAVTARLALAGSTFGRRDVLVTLAGVPQAHFDAAGARRWTSGFLAGCTPVSSGRVPTWTSKLAESADRRLEATVRDRIEQRARTFAVSEGAGRQQPSERLLCDDPVVVLAGEPHRSAFLAHTAVARECARVWQSAGLTVAVATRHDLDAMRWATLTGIEAFHPSARPGVLFVDQADRMTSGELAVLLGAAPAAKVVMVEGGTSLRLCRPKSRVLEGLGEAVPRLDPGRAPIWERNAAPGAHPAERLLERWTARLEQAPPMAPPLLVGLGMPEILGLNDAARRHLASLGQLSGPELKAHGRRFRAGDTVLAVRAVGPRVPAGTLGKVAAVDTRARTATVRWPDGEATAQPAALARIVHGYATTPRLAARTTAQALVLGSPERVGIERARVLASFSESRHPARQLNREVARTYGPDTWPVQR